MVVREQPGLGRVRTRPAGEPVPRTGAVPAWDDAVRVRTPDPSLDHAIEVARAAVANRHVLQPSNAVDGTARLAERLAVEDAEDDRLARILGVLRSRVGDDGLVAARRRPGPSHDATAVLGRCEAAQHDPRAWDRADALAAGLRDRQVGEGDPTCAAAFLALVTSLLAQPRGADLELLPVLPDAWFGEDVLVGGLPVPGGGRVSWELTWPLDWPALRWASSVPGRRIAAPGLAPGWHDARPRGRADLGPDGAAVEGL